MTDGGPIAGDPTDLDRIADALEGAGTRLLERNQHLAAMQDAVAGLTRSTDALVIAVTSNVERNRQFRWTMVAIGVLALIGIYTTVHISDSNHSLATKIESCTTPPTGTKPGGACYRDGQERTSAAVATLEQQFQMDAAAAAICARTDTEYDHILSCIQRLASGP